MRVHRLSISFIVLIALCLPSYAQLPPSADWAVHAANRYQIFPNLTYLTASNYTAFSCIKPSRKPA